MSTISDQERSLLKHELFKSGVVSALFSLFKSRKKQAVARGEKYLMQDMAAAAGVTKAQVSRWFNGETAPNWRISTVFDIAEAMDGELEVRIKDRMTGEVHTASGVEIPRVTPTHVYFIVPPGYPKKAHTTPLAVANQNPSYSTSLALTTFKLGDYSATSAS